MDHTQNQKTLEWGGKRIYEGNFVPIRVGNVVNENRKPWDPIYNLGKLKAK